MALRSPIRRVGLFLLTPFLLFGLVDLGRALVARTPTLVAADAYEAGFSREHITAHGLAHFETSVAYNVSTYYEHSYFREPIRVEPFALLPLNVPERSEGRVLLAEVPLDSEGQLPEDVLDRDRFEFTGLAGPLPEELLKIVADDFAPGTRFSRVQVRIGPPRIAVSLAFLVLPVLLLALVYWRAAAYERSEDAHRGFPQRVSKFMVLLGLPLVISVVWMRAQWDPKVDSVGLVIAAYCWQGFWLLPAFAMRGRRLRPEEEARPFTAEEGEDEAPAQAAQG